MEGKKRLLFISSQEEVFKAVHMSLSCIEVDVAFSRGHLRGLTILDNTKFDIVLAQAKETDIDGLEFAKLLRDRESKGLYPENYIILFGDDKIKDEVFSSSHDVDDFILYPFYGPELIWRVKRGLFYLQRLTQIKQDLIVDPSTDLLTPEGFFINLKNEINRTSRHRGFFSVLIIILRELGEVKLNFGDEWTEWIQKSFTEHLKNILRNYDDISKLQDNKFIILASDTDYTGLNGLANRLRKEYEFFFQELKRIGISKVPDIVHCGIAVCINNSMVKREMIFDYVREWIYEQIRNTCTEDELIKCIVTEQGPEIQWD